MKKLPILIVLAMLFGIFTGCVPEEENIQVATTTLPVYEFTQLLCAGTDITVVRVITENVSCLHDYTLKTTQMRMIEKAEIIVINGAGLEDFMDDALSGKKIIDASIGTHQHETEHDHTSHSHHEHSHDQDPHIWLSPENAAQMAQNIYTGLKAQYPQHTEMLSANLSAVLGKLEELMDYGTQTLSNLSSRQLITFHDGFGYFAESFNLEILQSVEEESGSEASAAVLKELITLINRNQLPAIFTESNGSTRAASIIQTETGVKVYALDMALSGNSYFEAMYHNIDTVKEALG